MMACGSWRQQAQPIGNFDAKADLADSASGSADRQRRSGSRFEEGLHRCQLCGLIPRHHPGIEVTADQLQYGRRRRKEYGERQSRTV